MFDCRFSLASRERPAGECIAVFTSNELLSTSCNDLCTHNTIAPDIHNTI